MLIRDVYGGDIGDYANVMMCFTIGVTLTTTVIMRRVTIERQGRAMMLSFLTGAFVLSGIYFAPPLAVLFQ